jgi:hypothetical protein
MPRSLLKNKYLKSSSTLRFILMVLGVCILLGSVAAWVGIADFDSQYSFVGDHQSNDLPFRERVKADPYDQLESDTRNIVDKALNGKEFTFEDDRKQLPKYVTQGNTYHEFNYRRTIDWTNPRTFGPILLGILGFWLTIEAIQHERMR